MAAYQEAVGLTDGAGASAHDLRRHLGSQGAVQGQYVQGAHGTASHGEHVGKGVSRGKAAEGVGIVHQGGQKVHRQHRGGVVADLVDGGVVGGLKAQQQMLGSLDPQVGVKNRLQYAFEVTRTPLGGSTALAGELGKIHLFLCHGALFRQRVFVRV